MTKNEKQKLYMYRAVRDVCDDHQNSWSGIPEFVNAYTAFGDKTDLLEELKIVQISAKQGVTETKDRMKKLLFGEAILIADLLKAVAIKEGDVEMEVKMTIPPSSVKRLSHIGLQTKLETIKQAIDGREALLEGFGITAAFIDVFRAHVNSMNLLVVKCTEARNVAKAATAGIKAIIKEIDEIFELLLEPMVSLIAKSDPVFAIAFINAHKVRKAAVRGKGNDPTTENPEHE